MTPEKELSSTSKLYHLSEKTSKRENEAREKEKNSTIGKFLELGTLEPDLPSPPNIYRTPTLSVESEEEMRRNAKIRKEAEEGLARQLRGLNNKKEIHSIPKDSTPSLKPEKRPPLATPTTNPFSFRKKFQKCQNEKRALTDELAELKLSTYPPDSIREPLIEYRDDAGGKTKKKRRSKLGLKKRTKRTQKRKRTRRRTRKRTRKRTRRRK